jgi:putative transposase
MTNGAIAVLRVQRGASVWSDGVEYTITSLLNLKTVLARSKVDGFSYKLRVDQLTVDGDSAAKAEPFNLVEPPENNWEIAQKRFEIIKPLLVVTKHYRKKADVEARGKEFGVSVATMYRWIDAYESSGLLSGLGNSRRSDKGKPRLSADMESLIDEVINAVYLDKQRVQVSAVVEELEARCRKKGITPPHKNTVRSRIKKIPESLRVSSRHGKQKAKPLQPLRGSFPGADWPLGYIQIDHTPLDIILVDDELRQPIGRPYITLALDVFSRMVAGFYLSFDPPSCFTVGMCIAHAVLPKSDYLTEFDISSDWPVEGKMKVIHVDNALEFRSDILKRACNQHQMDLQWRPVREPQYGGHVERFFRTLNTKIHELPGTTFSSVKEREYYKSEKYSAFTLSELEKWITTFIVDKYHNSYHTELNNNPISTYERGILGDEKMPGTGMPPKIIDRESFRIDFMPFVKRTIQNYGMKNEKIEYYHDVLKKWINATDPEHPKEKRKFVFHYDPRDISVFYFWDPELRQYFKIPYKDNTRPPISLWELKKANKYAKEEGVKNIDENVLFDTHEKLKTITAESVRKTASERKKQLREKQRKRDHERQMGRLAGRGVNGEANLKVVEDFIEQEILNIKPFSDIKE